MTLNGNNPITADGSYEIELTPGKEYIIGYGGTFGGGTVKLQYRKGSTADGDVVDSTSTNSLSFILTADREEYYINVAGATTPSIDIRITELGFNTPENRNQPREVIKPSS